MKRLKLAVVFVFAVFACFVYFSASPVVEGQNLGTVLAAPTGVEASAGSYTRKIGLTWDTIRDATSYRIFRNNSDNSSTASEVGTTPAPYFYDTTAAQNVTFFYWVRAENAKESSELSVVTQGLRSDGNANGPVQPLEPPPAPAGNPVTATKATLGKVLFWDEQLSATRTVSCGTCHINGTGGSDPRSVIADLDSTNPGPDGVYATGDDITASPGVPVSDSLGTYQWETSYQINLQITGRKANSAIDAGYSQNLFWDGRAEPVFLDPITNQVVLNGNAALESQAAGPPISGVEMGHLSSDWASLASQMSAAIPLALSPDISLALENWIDNRNYPELFEEAFGTNEVTPARIAMAIATYERTLFSDRTPMDLLRSGTNTLTLAEQRGRNVFNSLQCTACHTGETFSNDTFRYIGVRPVNEDLGRFAETNAPPDRGAFKVPGLRNVELRGPFMHNGRFETLADVVDFYDRGGDFDAPNKAPQITPIGLTDPEKVDLVAFLGRPLTDQRVVNETGPFSRPLLYTESDRVPVVSGNGRAGTGGATPQIIAIEPPVAGNTSFTVAVSNTVPNANAVLVIGTTDPGLPTTIPATGTFARETIQTSDSGSGIGYGSVSLSIPTTGDVVGDTFFGRWYIDDAAAPNGFSVSQVVQFTVFGEATTVVPAGTKFDFDGDSKADVSIFRPSLGEWWYLRSSDGLDGAFAFGTGSDEMVPADFTGDGITDFAFWRPSSGEWFVLRSDNTGFYSFPFGASGDIPVPGDFDGDGTDDPAVFRPSSSTWFILRSSDGVTDFVTFGAPVDKPIVADYDGDGKDDVAVYKPDVAQFWQIRSTDGLRAYAFGAVGDKAMAADFSGDGTDDIAVWRPTTGQWLILRSEDEGFYGFPFGATGDIPAAADYDGDGTADPTVFRESAVTWFSLQSTSGTVFTPFGASGDVPVPGAYVVE